MISIENINLRHIIDNIYIHIDKICSQNKTTLPPRDPETIEKIQRILITNVDDLNHEVLNMTKKNIFFTHPITNEIESVNFGINGGCQFAAYIHKKFGLLFLTRTDCRKDEYIPIIPSKQDAKKIKRAISYCMSYAKDSVIPSPTESAR
jgi:hypothetical protein